MNENKIDLLLFAFKKEAQSFIENLQRPKKLNLKQGTTLYTGRLGGRSVALCFISCKATKLDVVLNDILSVQGFQVRQVFNLGFAADISELYDVGDVVQAGTLVEPSYNVIDANLSLHNTLPIVRLYTSPEAVSSLVVKDEIINQCGAEAIDMEAAIVAKYVKCVLGEQTQFSVVKVISDRADKPVKEEVLKNATLLSGLLYKSFVGAVL